MDKLYKVPISDVIFLNMPNDNEFYFCIDLSGGKRIHRAIHLKLHPNNFSYIFLQKDQLKK